MDTIRRATNIQSDSLPAPVYEATANSTYSGNDGDYMDAAHHRSLELAAGTIALSFSVANLLGEKAIFSKDGSGYEDGGHLIAWIKDGKLIVRQQSDSKTERLEVPDMILTANQTSHLGVTFGDEGLKVWLNGEPVAAEPEFKQGIDANDRSLVIGGSRAWRDSDAKDAHSLFEGEIGNVMIFDSELGEAQMLALTEAVDPTLDNPARMAAMMEDMLPVLGDMHHGSETLKEILMDYGATEHGHLTDMPAMQMGTAGADNSTSGPGADGINGGMGNGAINGEHGSDILQGGFASPAEALANFSRRGDTVVFQDQNVRTVFEETNLTEITSDMLLT